MAAVTSVASQQFSRAVNRPLRFRCAVLNKQTMKILVFFIVLVVVFKDEEEANSFRANNNILN